MAARPRSIVAVMRAYALTVRAAVDMPAARAALERRARPADVADAAVPGAGSAEARVYAKALRVGFGAGATAALEQIPERVRKASKKDIAAARQAITVPVEERSVAWADRKSAKRVVEITKDQRQMIREAVSGAYKKGERADVIAQKLKRCIGLNSRLSAAVENRRAQMEDAGMPAARIDELSDKYAAQLLDYRAESIARTEVKEAQEEGRSAAWEAAKDEGLLPDGTKEVWEYFGQPGTARFCEDCKSMDGQEVDLGEPFYSETLQEKVDNPPLHPNCRCTRSLKFPRAEG